MNMCRICLSSSAEKDIQDQLESDVDGTSKNLVDIFMFCINIQIEPDLDVNTKLCLPCFDKILSFYEFKCLALKSDRYLKTGALPEPEVFVKDTLLESDIKSEDLFLTYDIKLEEPQLDSNDYLEADVKKEEQTNNGEVSDKDDAEQDCHSDDEPLSVHKKTKCENYEEKKEMKDSGLVKRKHRKVKKKQQILKRKKKQSKTTQKSDTNQMCEQCGKIVKNMKDHLKLHLPGAKSRPLKCKACDKTFARATNRADHYRVQHVQGKTECPICKKLVLYLKHHTQINHDNSSLKYACIVCERRFLSQAFLNRHMVVHTKDKPFQCEVCLKLFSTKVGMVQHKRLKHDNDKPHVCQFCSKAFLQKCHLQLHISGVHTNERPYECSDCGKRFNYPSIYKKHVKLHSSERVPCTVCDKTFKMSSYLRMHMRTHTNEKPYECKYCGMKFARSHHCTRHEAKMHEAKIPKRKKAKTVNPSSTNTNDTASDE